MGLAERWCGLRDRPGARPGFLTVAADSVPAHPGRDHHAIPLGITCANPPGYRDNRRLPFRLPRFPPSSDPTSSTTAEGAVASVLALYTVPPPLSGRTRRGRGKSGLAINPHDPPHYCYLYL